MRARTRILTRWGGISALAALVVLGMTMTDEPVVEVAPSVKAVWRPRVEGSIKKYPEFSYYTGNQRDIFSFKDLPKPKIVEPVVIVPKVKPEVIEPVKEPEMTSLNTSGLSLKGVIADTAGGGWAIIGGLGKYDQVKRKGDKVREAIIERILPDRIIVRKNKITGVLCLQRSFAKFMPNPPGKKSGKIEEDSKPEAASAQPRRRRRLGLSVRSQRGVNGLVVTRIRRDDINVQRGDILHAIDGEIVDSMSKAVRLIRKIRNRKTVILQLTRAGRDFSVRVPMEE